MKRTNPMCTNSWSDPLHFDLALCSFIESLWEDGVSKNEANDCVSGMLHYLPQLKGKIPGSKRLFVAWNKCELPTRAPPLNTFFLAALAGKAVALNDRRLAVSLLLGFHCMLRTGDCSEFERWTSLSWKGTPVALLCCTEQNPASVTPAVSQWSLLMCI